MWGVEKLECIEVFRLLFNDFYPETPITCTWYFQNGFRMTEVDEIV
jgi:hypothetical protein